MKNDRTMLLYDSNCARGTPLCLMIDNRVPDLQLRVIGHGHCHRSFRSLSLHNHMTAAPPDLYETVALKNAADIGSRQDPKPTHARRRTA